MVNHIFFITGQATASSSEGFINMLLPYNEPYIVGDVTYGKYYASRIFTCNKPSIKWVIQPVVMTVCNSLGNADFSDGIKLDYQISEYDYVLGELGSKEEPLLKVALSYLAGNNHLEATRCSSFDNQSPFTTMKIIIHHLIDRKRLMIIKPLFTRILAFLPFISLMGNETEMQNFYLSCVIFSILGFVATIITAMRHSHFFVDKIQVYALVFLCVSIISCIGRDLVPNIYLYANGVSYLIFMSLGRAFIDKEQLKKDLFLAISMSGIYVLLGAYISNSFIETHLGNKATAAVVISMSLCVLIEYFKTYKKSSEKLVLLILIIVETIMIVQCDSRTSIVVLLVYTYFSLSSQTKVRNIVVLVASVICIILYADNDSKNASSSGRMFILENTARLILNSPIFGNGGLDSFAATYPLQQAEYFTQNEIFEECHLLADNVMYAYNEYAQLICETGIVGGILFLVVLVICIKALKKDWQLFITILLPAMLSATFFYTFHIAFFINVVLIILLYVSLSSQHKRFIHTSIVFPILVIVTIITVYNVRKLILENQLWRETCSAWAGKHLGLSEIISHGENKKFLCAYATFHKDKPNQRIKELQIINRRITNSEFYYLLAKEHIKVKDYTSALKNIQLAISICPNRFRYRYCLFQIYELQGNTQMAFKIAALIVDMPIKIDSPLVTAIKMEMKNYCKTHSVDRIP